MNRIECPLEEVLREAGYVQVYDGQIAQRKSSDQFATQPEDRRFFTRYYQQIKNNHFVEQYAKLVYDLRSGWCTECNIYKKLPSGIRIAEQKLVTQKA